MFSTKYYKVFVYYYIPFPFALLQYDALLHVNILYTIMEIISVDLFETHLVLYYLVKLFYF
jgi:hypothetical protein